MENEVENEMETALGPCRIVINDIKQLSFNDI